ncbi:MAG: hypothetical protein ACJ796_19540 [Gemmatimonadaceae bacterium]
MTEWTSTADVAEGLGEGWEEMRPVRRTTRRSALRAAASRGELYADAREEGRLVRGRDLFIWRGRVMPIGLPLAAAAGLITWRRSRSSRDTLAIVAGIGLASYLEARVEWSLRRRAYRRRKDGA